MGVGVFTLIYLSCMFKLYNITYPLIKLEVYVLK